MLSPAMLALLPTGEPAREDMTAMMGRGWELAREAACEDAIAAGWAPEQPRPLREWAGLDVGGPDVVVPSNLLIQIMCGLDIVRGARVLARLVELTVEVARVAGYPEGDDECQAKTAAAIRLLRSTTTGKAWIAQVAASGAWPPTHWRLWRPIYREDVVAWLAMLSLVAKTPAERAWYAAEVLMLAEMTLNDTQRRADLPPNRPIPGARLQRRGVLPVMLEEWER